MFWRWTLPLARPRADLSRLPVELDLRPRGDRATMELAIGAGALGVAAIAWWYADGFGPLVEAVGWGLRLVPALALAIGIGGLAFGLRHATEQRRALIGRDGVRVAGHSMVHREDWHEPLSAFAGVRLRLVRRRGGVSPILRVRLPTRIYQVIELVHPSRRRTIPLLVRESDTPARRDLEALARLLQVPAIDAREGDEQVRAPEDLDKSVRELAAEGKVSARWEPGQPVPRGLAVAGLGDAGDGRPAILEVRILARRYALWTYGAVAFAAVFFTASGVAYTAIGSLAFGLAFAAALAWFWLWEGRNPRILRIGRHEIALTDAMPTGPMPTHIPHAAIEEVRLARRAGPVEGRSVVIVTDRGEMRIGSGLSRAALEWLRDLIVSAVVEA